MEIIFLFITFTINYVCYRIDQTEINPVAVLTVPYSIIIVLNNFLMVRYGFYPIEERVILMLTVGILSFFAGWVIVSYHKAIVSGPADGLCGAKKVKKTLNTYKINKIKGYVLSVEIITFFRLVFIVCRKGLSYIGTEEYSGYLISGILGHLFLSMVPLLPVLFLTWIYKKEGVSSLSIFLIGISLMFLTFIKYHVIGLVVYTFLLLVLEDRSYLRKGIISLVSVVVLFFIGNYFVGFVLSGTVNNISKSFYLNHLWNYIAGSLIYDNYIFTKGIRVGTSTFYKLGSFISAPVNLFLSFLFGIRIFPHQKLNHLEVGTNGELGNVVDAIGYLFPSMGTLVQIVMFALALMVIGMIITWLYLHYLNYVNRNKLRLEAGIILTFFVFFSFFGTFYINLMPYELLFWAFIMNIIFRKDLLIII